MSASTSIAGTPTMSREELLDAAMQSIDTAVTVYDPSGKLVYWNAAAEQMFPKARDTLRCGADFRDRGRDLLKHGYLEPRFLDLSAKELEWNVPDGRRIRAVLHERPDGTRVFELSDVSRVRISDARIAAALDELPLGIALTDAQGRVLHRNRALDNLYPMERREDDADQSLADLISDISRRIADSTATAVSPTVETFLSDDRANATLESELAVGDRTIEARWIRLVNGSIVTIHHDVTDQREADFLVRRAVEHMPIGIAVYDKSGRGSITNARLELFADFLPQKSLIGLHHDAVAQWQLENLTEYGAPASETGRNSTRRVAEALSASNSTSAVELANRNGRIARISTGRLPGGGIIQMFEDFTALREVESRFRTVVENIPLGVVAIDPHLRIVIANQAAQALSAELGISRILGMSHYDTVKMWRAALADDPMNAEMLRDEWWQAREQAASRHENVAPAVFKVRTGRIIRLNSVFAENGWRFLVGEDITDHRLAELRLHAALEALDSSLFLWDGDHHLVLWNRTAETMFPAIVPTLQRGMPFIELAQAFLDAGYITTDRAEAMNPQRFGTFDRVLDDGRILQIRRLPTSDGGFIVLHTDITSIRVAEQRLVDAISVISDSFVLFDSERRLIIWNAEFERELGTIARSLRPGTRYEELLAQFWDCGLAEAAPEQSREDWIAACVRRHDDLGGTTFERTFEGRTYRISKHPTAEGGVVRVGVDITELVWQRKQIERLNEAELAKRTRLLQVVLDNVNAGLAVFGRTKELLFWNPGLAALIDSQSGVADGTTVWTLGRIFARLGVESSTADSLVQTDAIDVDLSTIGGRQLNVRLVAAQDFLVLAVTDMTNVRRQEKEKLTLQARLLQAQKAEAVGVMSSTLAHDFNNILAVILGFATMTRSQLSAQQGPGAQKHDVGPLDEAATKFRRRLERAFDNIIRSANRGRAIIDGISAYQRREGGTFDIADVGAVAREVGKLAAVVIPSSAQFSVFIDEAKLMARIDIGQLEQALMNLCINGGQALDGRPGKVQMRVQHVVLDGRRSAALRSWNSEPRLRTGMIETNADGTNEMWIGVLEKGRYVEILISDNGIGMDCETLKRIFDPFFTTKAGRGGTGLGLASVANILSAHGGAIHVRSRSGVGTVFKLLIPVVEQAHVERAILAGHPGNEFGTGASNDVDLRIDTRILAVDDDPGVLELVSSLLEDNGFAVIAVTDPVIALERIRSDPAAFDLIISDQTMPSVTGRMIAEAAGLIRNDLPVIIMTGYSAESLEDGAAPANVRAVLRKPVSPDEMLAAIRAALKG